MKKLKIEYGGSVLSLPRENLITALSQANEFHLKVLILAASDDMLRLDYEACGAELCRRLDCTPSALSKAMKFWSDAGVMQIVEAGTLTAPASAESGSSPRATKLLPSPTLPDYSEGQAADVIEKSPELSGIIEMCQQLVGKLFTPAETAIVVGMFDHLRLDGEYIVTLVAYCKDNGKTSLRYIEKTALSLYDEGVDSTEKLEAYIKRKERREDDLSKIRTLIGAGARQFTSKEKKTFECWLDEWQFDMDVITRAFEVTVDKINEPSLPYMNRVLENWQKSGLNTIEAVESSLEMYKKNKAEAASKNSGFETDEFFEAALKRSDKYYQG